MAALHTYTGEFRSCHDSAHIINVRDGLPNRDVYIYYYNHQPIVRYNINRSMWEKDVRDKVWLPVDPPIPEELRVSEGL